MTNRQREVLQYLREYQQARDKPPTVREIQANFGFASPNSVAAHLLALERKGEISRTKGESRNITLLNKRTNSGAVGSAVE
jgi:repressor LexA